MLRNEGHSHGDESDADADTNTYAAGDRASGRHN
jgi:hypothetical protein